MTLSLDRQNAFRAQYHRVHPDWQPATLVYEQVIRQRITTESRVLDLGCGRGGVLEQLGDAVPYPFGLDPDAQSLREHRLPSLPRAVALAEELPIQSGSLDLVTCSWVLEHLATPAKVFAEVRRILRKNGSFIFLTPNATSVVAMLNRLLHPLQQTLVPRLYGRAEADTFPVCYQANTAAQISALAAQTGLRCEMIHRIEDPSYLAFTPLMFRFSAAIARITPPVHLVGILTVDG